MIRIRNISTFPELESIKNIWCDLEETGKGQSVFQSWVWNHTWCTHFVRENAKYCLDVKLVEDSSGHPLAILPFFKVALVGPMFHLVQFLGHRMMYCNDILLKEPQNKELADSVLTLLVKELDWRTVMLLRHLDANSTFTKQLVIKGYSRPLCPRLKVNIDKKINDQSMRFGKSTRKRFRGQRNKLKREFGFEFKVSSGSELLNAFDNLVELHHLRFASQHRTSRLTGKNLAFRKDIMLKLKDEKVFEIIQLRVADRTIASTLMAIDKQNYYCIQTGFDPEFASFSPMRILLTEVMRRGFDELGCEYFDLGPGYERYKYDWKPDVDTNYYCCIGGVGMYAKLLASIYGKAFNRQINKSLSTVSKLIS